MLGSAAGAGAARDGAFGAAPGAASPSRSAAFPGPDARGIDRHLRRLARREAQCRLVLGRLARAFVRRAGPQRLGFARLGDYTRERLGLSAREVQELARVSVRLGELPRLATAFAHGEIGWTKVRLVTAVATATDEDAWLHRARGRTVRALAAEVREVSAGVDDDDEWVDGEPLVRFTLRCPRRVRRRWGEAVELGRRMAGAQLGVAQVAEAIAAEGLAGPEVPAGTTPGWDAVLGQSSAAGDDAATCRDGVGAAGVESTIAAVEGCEVLGGDVDALLEGCDGLDAFALDARLRAARGVMQRLDWQTGRLLAVVARLRLARWLGFASFSDYVRDRLGFSARKARALIALDRRAAAAPALAAAYREGRVSWLRALTLLPVLRAPYADAWVARAQEVTLRRLDAEVEWAVEAGADGGEPIAPPGPDAPLVLPERQMCARGAEVVDAEIRFQGPLSVVALLRSAVDAFHRAGEPRWRGAERLLVHVVREWEGQPRHRDPVFERDGWRCSVPACSSRGNLHDHHVRFRSQGGDNTRENRVTVCAAHHLHGLHGGRVRVRGEAPDALVWELGVRADGPPLLVTRGDRYLDTAAA